MDPNVLQSFKKSELLNLLSERDESKKSSCSAVSCLPVSRAGADSRNSIFDENSFSYICKVKVTETEFVVEEKPEVLKKHRVETMLEKIRDCKEGVYYKKVCADCGKEYQTIRETCQNRYCPYCVEMRRNKAFYRLRAYRIRNPNSIHLTIGFQLQVGESKEQKQRREKDLSKMIKELGEIHALIVWDIKAKQKGNLKLLFMHYHLDVLPVKDFRTLMLAIRKIQEKFKGKATITNFGYKKTKAVLNYFASIMAGKVSTDDKHHTALYRDFLTPEEYLDLFYKKRMLRAVALTRSRSVMSGASGGELMFYQLGTSFSENAPSCCPACHSERFYIKKVSDEDKPPPSTQEKYFIKRVYITSRTYEEIKIPVGVLKSEV